MPTDLLRHVDGRPRIDLDLLNPEFLERLLFVLADCRNAGADFFAISGFRSFSEQAKLYFQGRTTPGQIVTNAQPGHSAHNFGLAADLCRDGDMTRAGLQPDYNAGHYEILRDACAARGLVWGGTFKSPDRPHVQLPGFVTGAELRPLREIWLQQVNANIPERLAAVWASFTAPTAPVW